MGDFPTSPSLGYALSEVDPSGMYGEAGGVAAWSTPQKREDRHHESRSQPSCRREDKVEIEVAEEGRSTVIAEETLRQLFSGEALTTSKVEIRRDVCHRPAGTPAVFLVQLPNGKFEVSGTAGLPQNFDVAKYFANPKNQAKYGVPLASDHAPAQQDKGRTTSIFRNRIAMPSMIFDLSKELCDVQTRLSHRWHSEKKQSRSRSSQRDTSSDTAPSEDWGGVTRSVDKRRSQPDPPRGARPASSFTTSGGGAPKSSGANRHSSMVVASTLHPLEESMDGLEASGAHEVPPLSQSMLYQAQEPRREEEGEEEADDRRPEQVFSTKDSWYGGMISTLDGYELDASDNWGGEYPAEVYQWGDTEHDGADGEEEMDFGELQPVGMQQSVAPASSIIAAPEDYLNDWESDALHMPSNVHGYASAPYEQHGWSSEVSLKACQGVYSMLEESTGTEHPEPPAFDPTEHSTLDGQSVDFDFPPGMLPAEGSDTGGAPAVDEQQQANALRLYREAEEAAALAQRITGKPCEVYAGIIALRESESRAKHKPSGPHHGSNNKAFLMHVDGVPYIASPSDSDDEEEEEEAVEGGGGNDGGAGATPQADHAPSYAEDPYQQQPSYDHHHHHHDQPPPQTPTMGEYVPSRPCSNPRPSNNR